MPSTETKTKAWRSREMDILSDHGNMEIMLGEGISNSIEKEFKNVMNEPEGHKDSGT